MKKYFLFFALFAAAVIVSCKKETVDTSATDCTGVTPTYDADVKAIMTASCSTTGCHNVSSKAAGIDLSTYALVKSAAAKDNFLGSISQLSGYSSMPRGAAKLTDVKIKTLTCWIKNGYPEK